MIVEHSVGGTLGGVGGWDIGWGWWVLHWVGLVGGTFQGPNLTT